LLLCAEPGHAVLSALELRAALAEQAVGLRVELASLLNDAVKPIIIETNALSSWTSCASDLLAKLGAAAVTQPPVVPR